MTTRVDGSQAEIEELKNSALWLSAAPVIPIAFALYVFAASAPDPAYATLPGVFLLLLARQWFEANYEQSRAALEKSRDYQFQLRQALDDLTEAHYQLTQLNRLAHNLRHQADEARRSKEQFVANASHELRTPLNMIIGFS